MQGPMVSEQHTSHLACDSGLQSSELLALLPRLRCELGLALRGLSAKAQVPLLPSSGALISLPTQSTSSHPLPLNFPPLSFSVSTEFPLRGLIES